MGVSPGKSNIIIFIIINGQHVITLTVPQQFVI